MVSTYNTLIHSLFLSLSVVPSSSRLVDRRARMLRVRTGTSPNGLGGRSRHDLIVSSNRVIYTNSKGRDYYTGTLAKLVGMG
jgi:hypothetical protein